MTNADKAPAVTCSAAALPYDLTALDQAITNLSECGPVPTAQTQHRPAASTTAGPERRPASSPESCQSNGTQPHGNLSPTTKVGGSVVGRCTGYLGTECVTPTR